LFFFFFFFLLLDFGIYCSDSVAFLSFILFSNYSDSIVFFVFHFISTILVLDFGPVLTVWYFSVFHFIDQQSSWH
jgi:hypothetical protein